jgi:hypothetical protein
VDCVVLSRGHELSCGERRAGSQSGFLDAVTLPTDRTTSSAESGSTSEAVVAEVVKIVVDAAGFATAHAAQAAVDGLPIEARTRCLDFGDDVAPRESVAPVRWWSLSMASRMAFLQLGGLSAILACRGGTLIAGPLMVSWRFVLCTAKPAKPL